jgi:hypothetical protein
MCVPLTGSVGKVPERCDVLYIALSFWTDRYHLGVDREGKMIVRCVSQQLRNTQERCIYGSVQCAMVADTHLVFYWRIHISLGAMPIPGASSRPPLQMQVVELLRAH